MIALSVDKRVPVVWFDSGWEFPEHRAYVHDLANVLGLRFYPMLTADPVAALRASGLLNHAAAHGPVPDLFDTLIAAPSALAHAQFGPGTLWGLRADESRGRRLLLSRSNGTVHRVDGTVATSPIWDWRKGDAAAYLASNGVAVSPVYARLAALGAPDHAQRVGGVISGGNWDQGRLTWLRRGWPDLYAELITQLPRLQEWR
jgi:phosphoadenosine phosphosulfate reductase